MVIMNIIKSSSNNRFSGKLFTLLMLASSTVCAVPSRPAGMPNGGCWADPMNDFSVVLTLDSFSSNKEGERAGSSFVTMPEYYPGWCYSESGANSASWFTGTLGINTPGKTAGYYKLSDDVDFHISVWFQGTGTISPPFYDKDFGATMGPTGNGVTALQLAAVGNRGSIDFKLRRTLIGGAFFIPGGTELFRLYRYVIPGYNRPTIPVYRLITQQVVVPVPVECRINNGKTIDVNFKLIQSSALTTSALSSSYQEKRQLDYKCNTGLTQDINVTLVADSAPFGEAIKTSNPDIGVVMLYNDRAVKPDNSFRTKIVNGAGSDNVTFAVIGSGNKPAAGNFTGSAVLIISSL